MYLGIRNSELESRYTALSAFVEDPQMYQDKQNSSKGHAAAVQDLRDIQAQVASMQRDVDEWKEKFRALQSVGLSSTPREAGMQTKPPLTVAAIEKATRQQKEQNSIELRDYFQTETTDSVWSKQMTELIEKRFTDSGEALMHARLIATECKSTLCRIDVLHENLSQQTAFEFTLPMLLGGELPRTMMFTEEKADGSIQQIIYLARNGYNFP